MSNDEQYELNITNQVVEALRKSPDIHFFVNKEHGRYEEVMVGRVLLELDDGVRVSVMNGGVTQPLYAIRNTACRAQVYDAIGKRHRQIRDAEIMGGLGLGLATPIASRFSKLRDDYKAQQILTKDAAACKALSDKYKNDRNKLIVDIVKENTVLGK